MTVLFWILAGLVAYVYVGYPLILGALALTAGRPRGRPEDGGVDLPTVSLLIPAYNEEAVIAAKIENTLALDYPQDRLEIIVASESADGTDAIAARYAARGVTLLSSSVRRGKVANLGRAVPSARGEVLVFTDANAALRPDALRLLARHFADPRVGAVSGRLVYRGGPGAVAAAERAYWGFEMLVKRASSRLGSLPGANGSLFALRRELYLPLSEDRGDDFELPIRVILSGHASVLEPAAVSEEEASARYRDEYRRKVRIINWMAASAILLLGEALARRRWLLAFQLVSHKLLRWAVPLFLLALAPVSLWLAPRGLVYLLPAAALAALALLALAGWWMQRAGAAPPRPLGMSLYFAMVNLAALVGLVTCAAGRRVAWHKRPDQVL